MVPVSEFFSQELIRSQGERGRSSLECGDPANVRRRISGKRTVIPPQPLAFPANVDSVNLPENRPETGFPEALESSEGDEETSIGIF